MKEEKRLEVINTLTYALTEKDEWEKWVIIAIRTLTNSN